MCTPVAHFVALPSQLLGVVIKRSLIYRTPPDRKAALYADKLSGQLPLQAASSQLYRPFSQGSVQSLLHAMTVMAASQSSMQRPLLHNGHVCRWDEMIFSIFVMLAQVGLEAYILGTLFHYVVKKDAKLEEFR